MPSADEIVAKMKEIQALREQAVGPLVEVLAERSVLLEQLAALDEPYGKAYAVAEAAGWTSEELNNMGADEPVKRPRKRSRSTAKRTDGQASGAAPVGGIPAQEGSSSTEGVASGGASS